MRQRYTTAFVVLAASLLILACVLFALSQGGQDPEPRQSTSQNRPMVPPSAW